MRTLISRSPPSSSWHHRCALMAVVASSSFMSRSESALMEKSSRLQLPPLSFAADFHRSPPTPRFAVQKTPVKRERRKSWDEPQHRPRTSRKTYSFSTSVDMETYNGHVRTPADAIILFEACRLGLLPRVQRRLSEKERQSIKSGSVFVWDEREAGMRRWTDGKSWSASRVSGSFLTYREMEGKRGGGGSGFPSPVAALSKTGRTPDSTRGSDSDLELAGEEGPDGYRYKPDGLMKQSFSITTSSGNHLHLISYYSRSHHSAQQLNNPSNDPQLRQIRPAKGMYPESTVHEHQNIPAVTRSPMASAPYSTIPQMAGYARQGPPQWAQHNNGYGWSQPQQIFSQPQYYGHQYSGSPHGGGPPPSNGHSPLQYSQSAQYSSHPPDPNAPPYDQRRSHVSQDPGYDHRRYSSTLASENRPPSHYHSRESSYGNQPREEYPPQYDSRRYPPQPSQQPPERRTPQPHPLHRTSSSSGNLPRPRSQSYQQSPHIMHSTPPAQHHPPPSSTPIDPRLMAPSPNPQQQGPSAPHSRTSTPAAPRRGTPGNATPPQANGTSGASTIPSIGALMNGASAEQYTNGNGSSPANGNGPELKVESSGDNSPRGTKKKDGPQDIPSDKVGFGEDMRALKVLDRAFKT